MTRDMLERLGAEIVEVEDADVKRTLALLGERVYVCDGGIFFRLIEGG